MPKPLSGKILHLEIRVSPYDQEPIVIEESDLQMFDELILCQEGTPNGSPKLHYHGMIKTTKSESWLRSFLRKISHAPDNEKINGNALYFTRKPHEHTTGYIVKSGNVVYRRGITQTTLDEWIESSNQYQKDKATDRKRKQRTRTDELIDIYEKVKKDLQDGTCIKTADSIIWRFLQYCDDLKIRFPQRNQMDNYVLQLLYPYEPHLVRSFYTRSFELIRT